MIKSDLILSHIYFSKYVLFLITGLVSGLFFTETSMAQDAPGMELSRLELTDLYRADTLLFFELEEAIQKVQNAKLGYDLSKGAGEKILSLCDPEIRDSVNSQGLMNKDRVATRVSLSGYLLSDLPKSVKDHQRLRFEGLSIKTLRRIGFSDTLISIVHYSRLIRSFNKDGSISENRVGREAELLNVRTEQGWKSILRRVSSRKSYFGKKFLQSSDSVAVCTLETKDSTLLNREALIPGDTIRLYARITAVSQIDRFQPSAAQAFTLLKADSAFYSVRKSPKMHVAFKFENDVDVYAAGELEPNEKHQLSIIVPEGVLHPNEKYRLRMSYVSNPEIFAESKLFTVTDSLTLSLLDSSSISNLKPRVSIGNDTTFVRLTWDSWNVESIRVLCKDQKDNSVRNEREEYGNPMNRGNVLLKFPHIAFSEKRKEINITIQDLKRPDTEATTIVILNRKLTKKEKRDRKKEKKVRKKTGR